MTAPIPTAITAALTADTSVVVPALTDWHEHHAIARSATATVDRLPAHVLAESFSVLTRLPHGLALSPTDATGLLLRAFPGPPLTLDGEGHRSLLRQLATAGLRGGAVYDGLVAATAAGAAAELLTLDARAAGTYRAVGVRFRRPG
jgi:hypothetical protein